MLDGTIFCQQRYSKQPWLLHSLKQPCSREPGPVLASKASDAVSAVSRCYSRSPGQYTAAKQLLVRPSR
jgi:hypothetical protein